MAESVPFRRPRERAGQALALLCVIAAFAGARPYAGGWNDGSRLAAVESLLERGTLAIDDSLFCQPPSDLIEKGYPPYAPDNADLLANGTRDKLLIGDHFYSDKPAVITLGMAGTYRCLEAIGFPSPAARPDIFCLALTIVFSGGAFLISLYCMHQCGRIVGLDGRLNLMLTAAIAFASFGLAYTRHVNNHIMQLAVLSGLCLQLLKLGAVPAAGRLVGIGTLGAIGFNLDLGSGPLLVAALFVYITWAYRRIAPLAWFALGAAPWIAACMAFNYSIGGVWKPMNMVPEYSQWPGCPFTPENMTGFSRHGVFKLPVYTLALMFGKKGFLNHNLPLMLALPALIPLLRGRLACRPPLLCLLGWCGATWLLYAVLSNNYGGACCSVRWFVPFLAPLHLLIAAYLRQYPIRRVDLAVLSAFGAVMAALMWWKGPWMMRMVPMFWPIVGSALAGWIVVRRGRRKESNAMGLRKAA